MCKPSPPPAPDPVKTVEAQTASNKDTAIANASLNRVNQFTPYGNSTYSIRGYENGVPLYNQTVDLSPGQQSLYDKTTQGQNALADTAIGSLGNVQSALGNPFSYGGPNPTGSVASPTIGMSGGIVSPTIGMSGGVASPTTGTTTNIANAGPDAIKQAQDAAYRGQTQYLDPQYANAQSDLDAKLAAQGLQVGDQAYSRGQQDFGMQKNQAYQSARDAATLAGNQQQNVLFGQGATQANLQNQVNQQQYGQNLNNASFQNAANQQQYGQNFNNAGFQNSANQQQFGQNLNTANLQNQGSTLGLQQAAYLYNQPLSSYNALMTGSQPTNPTFSNVPGVNQANTDVAGITNQGYQNQMAAYNAQQQGINNLFSLGGSLGSAAILASDRRLKRDIKRIGKTGSGIPIYEFSYIWDGFGERHIGVMADEVRSILPAAVVRHPSGYDMVDYSQVRP